jgi:phosphotransferase system HPr (HPr) family protein
VKRKGVKFLKSCSIELKNKTGLHARPAAVFVNKAQTYESEIEIEKDNRSINAKSIMGLMSLGAAFGDTIILKADGKDEEDAVEELKMLVADFE